MVKVRVELGGGVEQLFDKRKTFEVVLPAEVVTLAGLINHLATKVIKERPELFIAGDTMCVRRSAATVIATTHARTHSCTPPMHMHHLQPTWHHCAGE